MFLLVVSLGAITTLHSAYGQLYSCEDFDNFIGIPNEYVVTIDDVEYSGRYVGSMTNIEADVGRKAIIIDVPNDRGCIELELPRNLIDSQVNGTDVNFAVFVNGQANTDVTETIDSTGDRTLLIPMPAEGNKRVEIIGTTIAPELDNVIIGMILAIGLAASFIAPYKGLRR